MNTCEVCEKKFKGLQAWATICPRCAKEIADYRAGLWKAKEVTAGQESKEETTKRFYDYYRKKHPPRKCFICGKEFYVKGKSQFCDMHRSIWSMKLSEKLWKKTNKNDILKEMKQEYKDSFKDVTVVTEAVQPLNGFDRKIIQLGKC